jgi:hypothetical protein
MHEIVKLLRRRLRRRGIPVYEGGLLAGDSKRIEMSGLKLHGWLRFIGGPLDGQLLDTQPQVTTVVHDTDPEWEGMAYHRTHISTGTDPSLDWFSMDLPEPTWETVYEWHEAGWVAPAVQAIRDAVREGSRGSRRGTDAPTDPESSTNE